MNDYEGMAKALEETGQYKVLRKLTPKQFINPYDGTETRNGLFVDVETTGLDYLKDEIIEIAMVPFTYSVDGRIFEVKEAFQGLREPSEPISEEITAITGITNDMLKGQSIDVDEVNAFASTVNLVIAHNASFDRKFLENFAGVFETKAWGCSVKEVPWTEEGYDGAKLGYLANSMGFFFDAHRATDDCLASIEILSKKLPATGCLAFFKLLENARKTTYRIWAENAPFDFKDILKGRGYRWNPGNDGRPKAWYIDVLEDELDAEENYLKEEIYQRDVDVFSTKITAYDRYSVRV
ncbi:DNA polymerase III epsilon subunit and related 3'-5' exonuclease [Candidatus Terasakiella magnetica]|uniref:DNA polymerase III epsilon subunit and related 3'-5' exonuclease n=1 Tax=Candidatus Terasakiella magnetica TaxID=1867952 RepID=A0A1C3RFE5_9PROT|nr:3'-5' exonuclease [Candidatus Terasakiella magnetica]SCA55934.1 DNA polymerase III epsilon subunit and related 3'-5' exonuclease [Candidatus Terasakiella magnetica]